MTRAYKPSELTRDVSEQVLDNSYWHYFLMLESDFIKTLQFVQLDETNFQTFDQHKKMTIYPLKPWENKGGEINWWNAYNKIKHERHSHFQSATLEHTLHALGSLLILESYLYCLAYPAPQNIKFGTKLIRVPGLAEPLLAQSGKLPDFES
jgi:hypothetical protein